MVSAVTLGSGPFTYEVAVDWETLPSGFRWREVAAVAVDSNDRIFVFNRGDHPIIVFDRDGNFLSSWGEGVFTNPHSVTLGPDDTVYCSDAADHTVRQFSLDGKLLMTIGTPGQAAEPHRGIPFNRCTDVALDPRTGELYITDGYGNSRVHKYTPDGKLLFSWGGPGTEPGEFNIVHNVVTDADGYVYVADRENHRVQVFDRDGRYETQWNNVHRPCALAISKDQHVYVGELGAGMAVNKGVPNIGPRLSVLDTGGKVLARVGDLGEGLEVGQFVAPHGISMDSRGDLYVGEVSHTAMSQFGAPPDDVRSFQKLSKVS